MSTPRNYAGPTGCRMPPAARATVEALRELGYTVTVREQRTGSLRYRINGGPELTAFQMMRRLDLETPRDGAL